MNRDYISANNKLTKACKKSNLKKKIIKREYKNMKESKNSEFIINIEIDFYYQEYSNRVYDKIKYIDCQEFYSTLSKKLFYLNSKIVKECIRECVVLISNS